MPNELSQFLTAIFSDGFDVVPIRTQTPRNVELTPYNTPYTYTDLKRGAIYENTFTAANESKNVLLDISGVAVGAMVGELETINGFDCPPSAIVKADNRHFVLWILAEKIDRETWQKLENEIAEKLRCKPLDYVPLPSFNLVEYIGENYSYTPITLEFLDRSRRYTLLELEKGINGLSERKDAVKSDYRKSAESPKSAERVRRKSAETSKGELTYQKFVRLINAPEMKSAEILKSAETKLGLKSRRSEILLKSAVTRNDVLIVRRGFYSPKSGLPIAA
jgi:hypothetical protein